MSERTHSIGPYKVIAKIGQGGMAEVLLALKPGPAGFRKLLVIKHLRPELVEDEEYLTMFLDEARLAARLSHQNVVKTYEVGEHEGSYYIAMDYLEGQPFTRVLSSDPSLETRVWIINEVLAGLDYAHELCDFDGSPLGVIHRDVSPHNVFVTYSGAVQLLDFGIAKAAGASTQTRKGTFKGKVSYIAPEQAQALEVDRRADIFSVGVVLWEAVAGRRFARRGQDIVRLKARIEGTEPRLREVMPDADPILLDACDRAMALDAEERFQTADEFRQALAPYLAKVEVNTKSIGAWMTSTFAEQRNALAQQIETQISLHEQAQSQEIPLLSVATASSPTPTTGSIPETIAAPQPTPSAPPKMAIAVVVSVVAIAGLVAFVLPGEEPVPEPTTQVEQPPPEPPEPETRDITQEAVSFELTIEAQPANATILLDGEPVANNPYTTNVLADTEAHELEVRAEGHQSQIRRFAFDRDRHLTIALSSNTTTRPTMRTMRPRMSEQPVTTEMEPVQPPVMDAVMEAVMTPVMRAQMEARPIDETDPY